MVARTGIEPGLRTSRVFAKAAQTPYEYWMKLHFFIFACTKRNVLFTKVYCQELSGKNQVASNTRALSLAADLTRCSACSLDGEAACSLRNGANVPSGLGNARSRAASTLTTAATMILIPFGIIWTTMGRPSMVVRPATIGLPGYQANEKLGYAFLRAKSAVVGEHLWGAEELACAKIRHVAQRGRLAAPSKREQARRLRSP